MSDTDIAAAFASLEQDARWCWAGPWPEATLVALERRLGRAMPAPIAAVVRAVGSGEYAGPRLVAFFDDVAMGDVNATRLAATPFAFAFASDGGSGWYVVDVDDGFGRGPGAVWRLPAGAPFPSEARFVASDVHAFLEWMRTA